MNELVERREYDLFLSHSHADAAFVRTLYTWLTEIAGLKVWYDQRYMPSQSIAGGLQSAIERCRAALVVASAEAIRSGWVRSEVEIALGEQNNSNGAFRFIPLRLAGAPVEKLTSYISWIDVPEPELTPEVAASILFGLHPVERWPEPASSRDVYVSASWRPADRASAEAVCRCAVDAKFRLIGDSPTQRGYSGDRISAIVASCGAAIVVIPYRGEEKARADVGACRYFLREHDLAVAAGLPTLVIADPRLRRDDGDDGDWLRLPTAAAACTQEVTAAIDALWHDWCPPPAPHKVFYATDLEAGAAKPGSDVRRLIELVTGMPTQVGSDIQERDLQAAITDAIRRAFLVIADLTDAAGSPRFNVDVCIEAGMAVALGRDLAMMVQGEPRRPPFMLRGGGQLHAYRDGVEQLGRIRKLAWDYRRRVINAELL